MSEPGDWTLPALKEHFEALIAQADLRNQQRFDAQEKGVSAALSAQEKAVAAALASADKSTAKAEANAEKWRESANEWRGAMSDRDRELPSRREVEASQAALGARITALEKHQDHGTGRGEGIGMSTKVLLGALTAAATIISIIVIAANMAT